MKPLVSVVIPAYNRAQTITACVGSVLEQGYENLEVIVVDDGSSDDTARVVEEMTDPRVRLIRQGNAGANVARNTGLDNASGKYVALLDSDDIFLPGHLSGSVEVLERSASKTLVYSQVVVDRGDGVTFLKPPRALRAGENVAEYMLCDKGFIQTSTIMMRRELAANVRYLPGLPAGQDLDFAIRCMGHGVDFVMKPVPGAVWKDHFDPSRISAGAHPVAREEWLASVKDSITGKAYYGFRGWFLAKSYAKKGFVSKALTLYGSSVIHRPYSLKHSVVVFLQIILSGSLYRSIADLTIRLRGGRRTDRNVAG